VTTTEGRLGPAELRELFLFADLDDDQLAWVAANGDVVEIPAGADVYVEGAPAECFYVLLTGELSMLRRVGGTDIETLRTSYRGAYSGAMTFYLGDRIAQTYPRASAR